jgi:hypothetical protein
MRISNAKLRSFSLDNHDVHPHVVDSDVHPNAVDRDVHPNVVDRDVQPQLCRASYTIL